MLSSKCFLTNFQKTAPIKERYCLYVPCGQTSKRCPVFQTAKKSGLPGTSQNMNFFNFQISQAVEHLRSLRTLELRKNSMTELPHGAFDRLESVENLVLNNPLMAYVHPAAFSRMPSLMTLNPGFSNLRDIHPATFDGTPRLSELYLPGNNTTDILAITSATGNLPNQR